MCPNPSCICQETDLAQLERLFLNIWFEIFTVREEAELESLARQQNL